MLQFAFKTRYIFKSRFTFKTRYILTRSSRFISSAPLYSILQSKLANKTNKATPILIDAKTQCTYNDMHNKVVKYASYLQNNCNIKAGDKIMTISRHCIPNSMFPLVSNFMNTTLIPVNHNHSRQEFENVLKLTNPDIIFIEEIFNKTNIQLPFEHIHIPIKTLKDIDECDPSKYNINNVTYTDIMEKEVPQILMSTSGTTGMCKLIKGSFNSTSLWTDTYIGMLDQFMFPFGNKTICLSPPYHGVGISSTLTAMTCGKTVIYPFELSNEIVSIPKMCRANINSLYDAIIGFKVDHIVSNTMWIYELYNLFNHNTHLMQNLHKIKDLKLNFTIFGENIPINLLRNFMKTINNENVAVRNLYGATDAGGVIGISPFIKTTEYNNQDLEDKYYYFSFPPKQFADFKLNEDNELIIKSDVFKTNELEYIGQKQLTKDSFTPDGYFKIGDRCKLNKNGDKFRVMSRKQDIINQTFGHIIYPEKIENVLIKHYCVFNVIVVGIDYELLYTNGSNNDINTEKPIAFVQLNDTFYQDKKHGNISEDMVKRELYNLCENELNKETKEIPEQIHFVDEMPMSSGIKIKRYTLKQRFIQQLSEGK
eukprot:74978_1